MSIDPYSDPWPNDDHALVEAFNVCMSNTTDPEKRSFEAFEWALGAIANRRDSVFVHAVKYCFPEKLTDVFIEACDEKYMFAAMHLADQCGKHIVNPIEFAAQTGSLELLETVLGGTEITKAVADKILKGAFKGDCVELLQHYYPDGLGERCSSLVPYGARYNAIRCLQHFVIQPVNTTDWEFAVEYAFKNHGAQTLQFLWDNPPINLPSEIAPLQYAVNIAQRLIEVRLPKPNSKAFECLRLAMRYVVWSDFEAAAHHYPMFHHHRCELFELYEQPRNEQLKQRLHTHIEVTPTKTNARRM